MADPEQSAETALAAERTRTTRARPVRVVAPSEWEGWPDEKLLDLRLCDLDLRIAAAR